MAGQHVNMTIKVFLSRARWLQSVLTTRKPDLLTAWLKYKYVGTHPQSPKFCVFAELPLSSINCVVHIMQDNT